MNQTFIIPVETVGDRMRRARAAAGVSVVQMADDLEVSRGSITRWEHDHGRPRRHTLLAYAMRCGVPVRWLETGEVEEAVTAPVTLWKPSARPGKPMVWAVAA